jgi:inner membrane protein
METIEKIKNSLFQSIGLKLALIAFLSLILLIPSAFIIELIREREQRMNQTLQEVTSTWGMAQTITGPILATQVRTTDKEDTDAESQRKIARFLPEKLNVTGEVKPEIRYRGIYKVVTYRAVLHISGTFPIADLSLLQSDNGLTSGQNSWLELGISDMRGINKPILLRLGDSTLASQPGIPNGHVSASGVHVNLSNLPAGKIDFSFDLDLNGSESLQFIPVGKENHVEIKSSWNTPSFSGAFLPDNRNVTDSGFHAVWDILELNRNYPQQWIDKQYSVDESAFGVYLITPVDNYQKATRSAKYAILFIALTFLIFFFAEVMTRTRIHPFHYLLVGIALSVFYSLLTALSEYLAFSLSYALAAAVIILMISLFTHSLYRKSRVTLTVILSLALLYSFLFVILQLTDYSLLVGNIGLVIILGIVMYFSRKIDWYGSRGAVE